MNEKIMKRKEVSDNLQKNSFNPNKSKYLTNFENTSSESKKSNKNHKSERLHLKQINLQGVDLIHFMDLQSFQWMWNIAILRITHVLNTE